MLHLNSEIVVIPLRQALTWNLWKSLKRYSLQTKKNAEEFSCNRITICFISKPGVSVCLGIGATLISKEARPSMLSYRLEGHLSPHSSGATEEPSAAETKGTGLPTGDLNYFGTAREKYILMLQGFSTQNGKDSTPCNHPQNIHLFRHLDANLNNQHTWQT